LPTAAAPGGHSFGLDHRAAGVPAPLRYIGVPPASPLGCLWGQSRVGCTGKLHRGSATRRCL
jgi:hypothetical protein